MTAGSARHGVKALRVAAQLAGLVGGPVAWAAHQNLSYVLVPWVCGGGTHWVFVAATALTLAAATFAGYLSLAAMPDRASTSQPNDDDERRIGRGRLLSGVSISFAAIAAAGILVESLPMVVLDPCAGVP